MASVNTFIVEEDLPCFPDVTSNVATGENIVKMLANKCANFGSFLAAELGSDDHMLADVDVGRLLEFVLLYVSNTHSKRKIYNGAVALYIITTKFKSTLLEKYTSNSILRNISAIAWILMHKQYSKDGTLVWFICLYTISRFIKNLTKVRIDNFRTNAVNFLRILALPVLKKYQILRMAIKRIEADQRLNQKMKRLSWAGITLLLKKLPPRDRDRLVCIYKDFCILDAHILKMNSGSAKPSIKNQDFVLEYLNEIRWIKYFSIHYGFGGTVSYQHWIMASLLTQIEELHTKLPTKLSVDSIELCGKFIETHQILGR